jgi:hypothetical protein
MRHALYMEEHPVVWMLRMRGSTESLRIHDIHTPYVLFTLL